MSAHNSISFRITGVTPLILHNPQMEGMTEYAYQLLEESKRLKKKRNRTETEETRLQELSFYLSLYLNEENQVIIPGFNLRACFLKGARKIRRGPLIESGMFVNNNPILEYEGEKDPLKMFRTDICFTCRVNINEKMVPATRAKFNEWALLFKFDYLTEILDQEILQEIAYNAGLYHGIGTWRKGGYGRFNAEMIL